MRLLYNRYVMSDSLRPHGLQHTRLPWLSLSPRVCSNVRWVDDAIQSSHLLCPLLLPSLFPSIRVFSSELPLNIRWPKYWSFSFSISPTSEYSGLISFRIDWLDLLAVQVTLKSLLQHYALKASVLQRSAFFMVQFSHPYMTTGKTIALTTQIFVSKVMSLLFHKLSRFVPRVPLGPRFPHFRSCFSLPLELFSFFPQLCAAPGEVQFALG